MPEPAVWAGSTIRGVGEFENGCLCPYWLGAVLGDGKVPGLSWGSSWRALMVA